MHTYLHMYIYLVYIHVYVSNPLDEPGGNVLRGMRLIQSFHLRKVWLMISKHIGVRHSASHVPARSIYRNILASLYGYTIPVPCCCENRGIPLAKPVSRGHIAIKTDTKIPWMINYYASPVIWDLLPASRCQFHLRPWMVYPSRYWRQ